MSGFKCAACGDTRYPAFVTIEDVNNANPFARPKMFAECVGCHAVNREVTAESLSRGIAMVEGRAVEVDTTRKSAVAPVASVVASPAAPVSAPSVAPAPTPPVATAPQPPPAPAFAAPGDVVAMVRNRRDWLVLQIAQADSYRAELKMLDKMLGKTTRRRKRKPAARVTPLRAVGG